MLPQAGPELQSSCLHFNYSHVTLHPAFLGISFSVRYCSRPQKHNCGKHHQTPFSQTAQALTLTKSPASPYYFIINRDFLHKGSTQIINHKCCSSLAMFKYPIMMLLSQCHYLSEHTAAWYQKAQFRACRCASTEQQWFFH
jgi:hypothetical protein